MELFFFFSKRKEEPIMIIWFSSSPIFSQEVKYDFPVHDICGTDLGSLDIESTCQTYSTFVKHIFQQGFWHRIMEEIRSSGTSIHLGSPPFPLPARWIQLEEKWCLRKWRLKLDQAAQSLVQSSSEYLKGWRFYNLCGPLCQCLTTSLWK